MSTGLTLQGSVHPELAQSGDLVRLRARSSAPSFRTAHLTTALSVFFFLQTVKAVEQFGAVVEEMLIKHGKKIIGERARGGVGMFGSRRLLSNSVFLPL